MTSTNQLSRANIVALGFMTFAFFLGAGNIIFPTAAGMQAGENFLPTMVGFLLTAVGMPLITLLAIARSGGALPKMTEVLPPVAGTALVVAVYLIIGPLFATPRTALVAYEIGLLPFIEQPGWLSQLIYSVIYFSVAAVLSLHRGSLLDYVGKVMTPILVVLLVVLSLGVLIAPQGAVAVAQVAYQSSPFTQGFLDGYNTLDVFGSLVFGMLIIDVLRKKGISDLNLQTRYLAVAAVIAAAGLAFVYISLFRLGATSGSLVEEGANGAAIIQLYVNSLFGPIGAYILAVVVTLACLTTAVGLTSAFADYFSNRWPQLQYRPMVVIVAAVSALVANVGLDQLIEISVPVLYGMYPVAIALVAIAFVKHALPCQIRGTRFVLSIAFLFALLDAAAVSGIASLQPLVELRTSMPLGETGFGWVVPVLVALYLSLMFKPAQQR